MSREIAVDSTALKNEVFTMARALEQLETRIDEAYLATRELDNMWDGPANAAFREDFNNDRLVLLEMCDSLRRLVDSMGTSRMEYERCGAEVMSIVDGIRI